MEGHALEYPRSAKFHEVERGPGAGMKDEGAHPEDSDFQAVDEVDAEEEEEEEEGAVVLVVVEVLLLLSLLVAVIDTPTLMPSREAAVGQGGGPGRGSNEETSSCSLDRRAHEKDNASFELRSRRRRVAPVRHQERLRRQ